MTRYIKQLRFTRASMLGIGQLALLLVGFSHPSALRATPIVFKATTLDSDGCGASISGDGFSLAGTLGLGGCGGRLAPVGIGGEALVGPFNIPQNPGRYGIASGPYQPSLYKDPTPQYVPYGFTGTVDVNVVLSGSLQVCLTSPGLSGPNAALSSGCDPQFANFGVININVAGLATYYAFNGDIGARSFEGFYGTSAAAPEPANLGLVAGVMLLLTPIISQQKRRKTPA